MKKSIKEKRKGDKKKSKDDKGGEVGLFDQGGKRGREGVETKIKNK